MRAVKILLRVTRSDGTHHTIEAEAPEEVANNLDRIISTWSNEMPLTYNDFKDFEKNRSKLPGSSKKEESE